MASDTITQIKQVLESVRPMIQRDGGDIQFVSYVPATGTVTIQFQGACVGCPIAEFTLKLGIEQAVQEAVPEVQEVVAISQEE